MYKQELSLFVLCLIFSGFAAAADFESIFTKVSSLGCNINGTCYIYPAETVPDTECSNESSIRWEVGSSSPAHDEIMSLLLASKATDATVKINYDTRSANCIGGYPKLNYVTVQPQ